MPVSSSLQTGLDSETKCTTTPLVSTGEPAAVYVVPKPAMAPMEVDGSGSSASTVVVMGTEEIVTQAATPSTSPSETTQLILNPAVSPESTPQDTPSSDSGIISNVDSARVNAFFVAVVLMFYLFSVFIPLIGGNRCGAQCCRFTQSLGDPCMCTATVIVLVYLYKLQNFMDDGPSRGTRRSRRATIKTEKGIFFKSCVFP